MDVLSKAAVAEITKLVEDESVVLRLEISQRDGEILELKRSLRRMEVDLFEAQESIAKAEATRCTEEINAFGAYGLQGRDKGKSHEYILSAFSSAILKPLLYSKVRQTNP